VGTDPGEDRDSKLLNYGKSTLLVEVSPSSSKGMNPALPKETVMTSHEAVAVHDNAEFTQNTPPPLFTYRPTTTLKFQQAPTGKVQS
jgi:hypothetical protein